MTDAAGRVVVLHGLNVVAKGKPQQLADRGFGADDLDLFAREGFNTVRLGIDYAAVEPQPGVYDEAFLERYAQTVALAGGKGVLTLVDLHQDLYSEKYFAGNGMPAWMAIDDGVPEDPNPGFPGGYFTSPAINRAYDNLWANVPGPDGKRLQDHYAEGLRRVAARFAGEDRLVGYDIFNEPWPGSDWPTCANPVGCPPGGFDQTELTAFSKRAVAGIRRADTRHLAFYEPNLQFDVGAATGHGDVGDGRAGFSFHNYCLGAAPGLPVIPDPTGIGCDTNEQIVFDNAEAQSERTGDALLLTEFGATDDTAALEQYLEVSDRNMVGWHYWTYANLLPNDVQAESQSVIRDLSKPPTTENLKQGHLDVMARAYPQVVAGTPRSWDFDRTTGRFDLRYSTTAPNGESPGSRTTEVFLPRRHYGESYRVAVKGAEVASEVGAELLRLKTCPGAQEVSVTVRNQAPVRTATCVEATRRASSRSDGDEEASSNPDDRRNIGAAGARAGADAGHGPLPFTGLAIGALAIAGLVLASTGLLLHRRGAARPTSRR